MLRFLTHKLKQQSLNEEQQQEQFEKAQEDHDSGTESDDESGDTNGFPGENSTMENENGEWGGTRGTGVFSLNSTVRPRSRNSCEDQVLDIMMVGTGGGRDSANSQFEPCYIDSALPSDSDHAYDHHSSEEELEVINSSYQEIDDSQGDILLGDDEVRGPGCENKRKWSQMACNRMSVESTSSSDDEVQGLLRPVSTPVEFCTSPPVDVHKPSRSQSPPPKLFLFSLANGNEEQGRIGTLISGPNPLMNGHTGGVFRGLRRGEQQLIELQENVPLLVEGDPQDGRSQPQEPTAPYAIGGRNSRNGSGKESSRKRHRHHNPRHIQRPWLDFEKMQQLKARSVTTWRSGGELSLYCS